MCNPEYCIYPWFIQFMEKLGCANRARKLLLYIIKNANFLEKKMLVTSSGVAAELRSTFN
ncbi:hypothetical protein BpHYR1_046894 [Brachionus plicatilis]|uniref:FBD domain-containing protein n=1 Tax=Brachionus plicatilis TaxID=10195 RepID=A0A3M7PW05_BRAPC|nr:hypothetical protein BpHYR1_046894 [Brachionus plicatilis]